MKGSLPPAAHSPTKRPLDSVEELEREKEFMTSVLDTVACLVLVLDRQARIVRFNRACEETTGYSAQEVVGEHVGDLFLQDDERAGVMGVFNEIIAGNFPQNHENHWRTKGGDRRLVAWSNTALLDAAGQVEYVIASGTDITEKRATHDALRAAHAELRATNQELERRVERRTADLAASNQSLVESYRQTEAARALAEEASQAKTAFLSRMSHELRTPMNSIMGFSQLLEMRTEDEQDQESIGYIMKSGKRLLELIDTVLDISNLETGTFGMVLEPVELDGMLTRALDDAHLRAAKKGVDIETLPADFKGSCVLSSAHRLSQALDQILAGALTFAAPGGRLQLTTQIAVPGRLAFRVWASGPGIPPELEGRVFRPFEMLEGADGLDGIGVGLPLAKALLGAMGGDLTIPQNHPPGTCFQVDLQEAVLPARKPLPDVDGESRPIVVCADADAAHLQLLQHAFGRTLGLRVVATTHGHEALDMARRLSPAIVVISDDLADISLVDLLAKFEADPEFAAIPVIAIGDASWQEARNRMVAAGAIEYFDKPLALREISAFASRLVP